MILRTNWKNGLFVKTLFGPLYLTVALLSYNFCPGSFRYNLLFRFIYQTKNYLIHTCQILNYIDFVNIIRIENRTVSAGFRNDFYSQGSALNFWSKFSAKGVNLLSKHPNSFRNTAYFFPVSTQLKTTCLYLKDKQSYDFFSLVL